MSSLDETPPQADQWCALFQSELGVALPTKISQSKDDQYHGTLFGQLDTFAVSLQKCPIVQKVSQSVPNCIPERAA